jgi:hypothetical protein
MREYWARLIGAVLGTKALRFPTRSRHPYVSQPLYIVPSMTQYIHLISRQSLSTNMVIRARVFFSLSLTLAAGSLPHAVTMPNGTEVVVLRARLEAIVNEAEDAEEQAVVAHRHVQATRILLEEESKATALEQTATATRQRVPSSSSSSSSLAAASQLVPTASLTYEDTVVAGLHHQAAAVLNVCQLVNIVLDSSSTNYASCRDLIEQAL